MNISGLKASAALKWGRTTLTVQKYSPEILLVGGVVGVVAATVMACKATLKVDEIRQETEELFKRIEDGRKVAIDYEFNHTVEKGAEPNPQIYTEEEYKRDLTVATVQSTMKFVQLYAPSILLGTASIALLVGSNRIMAKRYAGLAAAYKLLDESYKHYRRRVEEELGEDADRYFMYGEKSDDLQLKLVDGKGKDVDLNKHISNSGWSIYSKFFDQSSGQYRQTPEYNVFFLDQQERYANHLLNARGHVFLNEIYDALDIPRTKEGCVVGWVKGHGDDYIDFGIFDKDRNFIDKDYVNGYRKHPGKDFVRLDFNVDGAIWEII